MNHSPTHDAASAAMLVWLAAFGRKAFRKQGSLRIASPEEIRFARFAQVLS
jgi:hypothetical protein